MKCWTKYLAATILCVQVSEELTLLRLRCNKLCVRGFGLWVWGGVCGRKLNNYCVGVDFLFLHSWILAYLKDLSEKIFLLICVKCGSVLYCLVTLSQTSLVELVFRDLKILALFHFCRCRHVWGFYLWWQRGSQGLLVSSPQHHPSASTTQNLKIELGSLGLRWKSDAVLRALLSILFD